MRISVIIPTYNRAELLRRTLDSVLLQKRLPDEIIVVDDGSTDDTRHVVTGVPYTTANVRYIYQKNAYLGAARNKGMHHSTGDLLLFLDSDDLLRPDALASLEAALVRNGDASLAFSDYTTINAQDEPVPNDDTMPPPEQGEVWAKLVNGNFIRSAGSALVRRDALRKVGDWDTTLRGVEDYDMWLRLADIGPFVYVSTPLFKYRMHGNNMSGNGAEMKWYTWMLYRKHLRYINYNKGKRQYLMERTSIFYSSCIRPSVFGWVNDAVELYRNKQYRSANRLMRKSYLSHPLGVLCYLTHTMPILHAIEAKKNLHHLPVPRDVSDQ